MCERKVMHRQTAPAAAFLSRVIPALLLLLALCAAAPAAEAPAEDSNASLAQFWTSRAESVAALIDEAKELNAHAQGLAKPLTANLRSIKAQFARLNGLYQASRGRPAEQLSLLQQIYALQRHVQTSIAPLEEAAATIKGRLDEITAFQNDLSALSRESAAEGLPLQASAAEGKGLQDYGRLLSRARGTLAPIAARLDGALAPAKLTLDRINATIADIEGSLVDSWRNYYLAPSDATLNALTTLPSQVAEWVSSLDSRMGFAYPQNPVEWGEAVKDFTVAAFIMAILGILGLRGSRNLPQRWRHTLEQVIKGPWVRVGIGFSVLAASTNQYDGIYFAFTLLGSLIIIGGVASMSWRLRVTVLPALDDKPSPLGRLYIPAALGVLMLFSDLPTRLLGIAWGAGMAAFLAWVAFINHSRRHEDSLPLLERISYSCSFWFGLASLLVAVAGYARLAILVFMLLFALVNTITLGNALAALFDLLTDRTFSKKTQPVRNAVAQAIAIPTAWLLSLVCAVPWFWAVPGASKLIEHALSTHYTVGEASFNFSKVLLAVPLFFLFRSFIRLSKASLDHLPERLPSLEQGVIPPLRTLATYGLWSLFAMVVLGLLGVSLTSLAVVAGGLSVGIGFGMQNIFNNLVSGLLLIFGRTILVGDYVEVAGAAGTVREISIRSTTIETPERALIYVPNSVIMSGQLTNWTRNSRVVRRSLAIGVAYDANTDTVKQILLQAAEAQEHVLQYPAPTVFFTNFGPSSLDFTVNIFIDDFDNSLSTLSALRFAVKQSLAEHGIAIPFPQLTLHMPESAPSPSAESAQSAGPEQLTGKT